MNISLEYIEESVINGQLEQAKRQIKDYGKKRFINDLTYALDPYTDLPRFKTLIKLAIGYL